MKVVGIVPARSGSKTVSNKNMTLVQGISLLEHAVKIGVACNQINEVYVSTDSPDYEALAIGAGAKSIGLRPAKLASDTAKTVDVLLDLLPKLDDVYDVIVLLQPTGPVRTVAEIDRALEMLQLEPELEAVISVSRLIEPHPYKLKAINPAGYLTPFMAESKGDFPKQSLPAAYQLTGAIYAIRTSALVEQKTCFPAKTRPLIQQRAVNIDTEDDLLLLEFLLEFGKLTLR